MNFTYKLFSNFGNNLLTSCSLIVKDFILFLFFFSILSSKSSLLLFVCFWSFFISSSLFNNKLHWCNSLSHSWMQLYFNCVKMEMHILSKTNQLWEWLFDTLFKMWSSKFERDHSVAWIFGDSLWEILWNFLWDVFVLIVNTWGVQDCSLTIFKF